jgi:3-isopropylmalate/(R)-2-methylmalate dehydratase small subunit
VRMRGRAHRFGDHINTDYIIAAQHKAASLDVAEMSRHTFEDIDPGFTSRVHPGDLVVAGANFGCGSSRETAAHVLAACGIAAVIAQSFARIFFRNAVNTGLPAVQTDTADIVSGDVLELDLDAGRLIVPERGLHRDITPLPPIMQAVLTAGGLAPYIRQHGDLVLPEQDSTHTRPEGLPR